MRASLKLLAVVGAVALAAAVVPGLVTTSSAVVGDASVVMVHGLFDYSSFDFCANDSTVLTADLAYAGVTTTTLTPGTYDFTIKDHSAPACASGLIRGSADGVVVGLGASISLVAGKNGGAAVLDAFTNPVDPVASGQGRVAVYHAAFHDAVDVLVNGGPGPTNVAPGTVKSADLPTAAYDFSVTDAGTTTPVLLDLPNVTLPAGKLLQIFAISGQSGLQAVTNTMALTTTVPTTTPAPATTCHVAWVTNWQTGTVAALNTDTRTYGTAIPVGANPWGVAVTPDGTKALVTSVADNTVTPVDLVTNTAGPPISVGTTPRNVAITPDGKRGLVVSNEAGQVTPIDLATDTAGVPIPVAGPVSIAVTPDGTRALVGVSVGIVSIDLATDTAAPPTPVPGVPNQIAVTPDSKTALLAMFGSNELQPVAVATGTLLPPIPLLSPALGVAVTPDGKTALATELALGTLVTVNLATGAVTATVGIPGGANGTNPSTVAVASDGTLALVVNDNSNLVIPVILPRVTVGTPISNGDYTPPTSHFALAFDATCKPPAAPAVAAEASPAFTG